MGTARFLPSQRITTTNSIELLSQVPLREICRLVRHHDHTQAYWLERHSLGKEDLRKLTFHIHHNRGLALFAKAWILVEGETEVWILQELARLLDIHLEMEGIKIVEFAQCGLRPLIKYARAMGIEWYVLTDGDDSGKRYADTVKVWKRILLTGSRCCHKKISNIFLQSRLAECVYTACKLAFTRKISGVLHH